jgi:pimeloyl-ACP methyl ester carboxylesterase
MQNGSNKMPVQLYKEVYGTGDPILCIHGLGASLYSWRNFIKPFSRTHKLILLDLKGCGKSPKPADASYSIDEKADEVYDFILRENLTRLTLIGNSLGGGVALMVAIRLSENDPDRLKRLVLIDSAGDKSAIPKYIKLLRSFLGKPLIYLTPSSLATRMTLRVCYHDDSKFTRDDVVAYSSPLATRNGKYSLLQTSRNCIPADFESVLGGVQKIRVPTLIIWGRQDAVIPLRVGEFLHQLIPQSSFAVIEDCGHIPQEEKPAETIALITRFLAENP